MNFGRLLPNYENQNRLCLCRRKVKLARMRYRINYTLLAVSTLRGVKSRSCFRQNLLRLHDVRRLQISTKRGDW